jgi:hypothetical protein
VNCLSQSECGRKGGTRRSPAARVDKEGEEASTLGPGMPLLLARTPSIQIAPTHDHLSLSRTQLALAVSIHARRCGDGVLSASGGTEKIDFWWSVAHASASQSPKNMQGCTRGPSSLGLVATHLTLSPLQPRPLIRDRKAQGPRYKGFDRPRLVRCAKSSFWRPPSTTLD